MGMRPLEDAVQLRIEADVRRGVAEGKLYPGQPLPSVRKAATVYETGKSTVQRAYQSLVADGILITRPMGFEIAKDPNIPRAFAARTQAMLEELRARGYPDHLIDSLSSMLTRHADEAIVEESDG